MKNLMRRILSVPLGMDPYMTGDALKLFKEDLLREKRTSFKEKLWAYRRGFLSGRIPDYGLDATNYKDYLSDWAYFRMYPLNDSTYSAWIDDKLTTRLVLTKYRQFLPRNYFSIEKGQLLPSVDQKEAGMEGLFGILREQGALALKREAGSFGRGFLKLEAKGGGYLINGQAVSRDELQDRIRTLEGYLVTEFIQPNPSIAEVYPRVVSTIRLMIIKDEGQPAVLANAFIRFGTDQSGEVDNAATGIIAALLERTSGRYDGGLEIRTDGIRALETHPDTGVRIQGTIPGWSTMVAEVLAMADYLGKLSWLGFDIVVTEDSFRVLEINSHQNIRTLQYFYPLLKDNPAEAFLKRHLP